MALEFINRINAQDVDGIFRFLSDDHVLIDAQDSELEGKERMREGWAEYFMLFFTPSRILSCGKCPRLSGNSDKNKYTVFPKMLASHGKRSQ